MTRGARVETLLYIRLCRPLFVRMCRHTAMSQYTRHKFYRALSKSMVEALHFFQYQMGCDAKTGTKTRRWVIHQSSATMPAGPPKRVFAPITWPTAPHGQRHRVLRPAAACFDTFSGSGVELALAYEYRVLDRFPPSSLFWRTSETYQNNDPNKIYRTK